MKKKLNDKKRTNIFKKIIKSIINFFDKILITPISKFIYFILDKISVRKGTIERIFNKPNTLLYVSLICAFVSFILIDTRAISLQDIKSVVLNGRKVTAEYNDEAYVVEGLPEKVNIILMGRTSDLYLAKQLGEHQVTLDLSDYGVGTHKVDLKYNNPINNLEYMLSPSDVTVVIYPKVSEVRTLTQDIINTDKLSETLVVSNVILDRDEVIIKSYQEKLDKVASVKALVDVNSLNATTAGTYTLENVRLVAYDENGTEIPDIEIVPGSITATITITSPSKDVPIKIVPIGEVASGNAIELIESNVTMVTVYADETVLENLNSIEIEIDVNGLSENKTFQNVIPKPNGARSISETTITIKVTMEKETTKDFENISIQYENLAPGLDVSLASEEYSVVSVTVRGVKSLLEKLKSEDITAYVDLEGLAPGPHTVPVLIKGSDLRLTYTSKRQSVNVIITN